MSDKIKVLVADDDRRMVKTICDILVHKGYEAVETHSGEAALEKVKSDAFDCVLMDIKMPGIGGLGALKRIRNIAPGLPVVLMSADITDQLEREARELGVYAVLAKPFDFQVILAFLPLLRREETVLVVDDDPRFSSALKESLEARGCRVETEWKPDAVLGHLDRNYQLAVLLGMKVDKTDGLEVLRKIRGKYPTKPVVLLAGPKEAMSRSIEKGLRSGAYSCIHKPPEPDRLVQTIREIKKKKLQNLLGAEG